MKITKAKVGMKVSDKIGGKIYEITATNELDKTKPTKATATEILEESAEQEPEVIEITAENDITFNVIPGGWVPDETLYNAGVVNGVLVIDGDAIEMGDIEATEIVKLFPGTIVFTAKAHDGVKLMNYLPARDKFNELLDWIPEILPFDDGTIKEIENSETRVVLGYSLRKEVEEENEKGEKEKKMVFDKAGVIVITARSACNSPVDEELDLGNTVLSEDGRFVYIPVVVEEDDNWFRYAVWKVTNHAEFRGNMELPEGLVSATRNRCPVAKNLGAAVYVGESFVQIGEAGTDLLTGKAVGALAKEGYKYLVDVNYDGATTTYAFATSDRKVKKVIRKATADRGDVISVEA